MYQDKQQSFALPLPGAYWKLAFAETHELHKLVLAAMFVAMRVAVSGFYLPVGENLNVYFGFLVTSVCGMICGPVLAVMSAFASDLLGYFIFPPAGAFFFGYTLSEMMGALFYALLLYRTRVSVVRLGFAKLLVNGLVNVCLGSLWSAILYSKGFYYYLVKSVIKNVTLLPIEVLLLVLLFQVIVPAARRMHLIPDQSYDGPMLLGLPLF